MNKKYEVTEIAPEAFANNASITSVVIQSLLRLEEEYPFITAKT